MIRQSVLAKAPPTRKRVRVANRPRYRNFYQSEPQRHPKMLQNARPGISTQHDQATTLRAYSFRKHFSRTEIDRLPKPFDTRVFLARPFPNTGLLCLAQGTQTIVQQPTWGTECRRDGFSNAHGRLPEAAHHEVHAESGSSSYIAIVA